MMDALPLQILLLGPVDVKYKDSSLKIQRRIERAILYFLAVENKPVSRSLLIDKLWPDADQTDPRGALRTALSRLRKNLPDPDLLITELDQVYLKHDQCYVDLIQFEEAYQNLRHHLTTLPENQPLPTHIVNHITEAIALWRGETIIQGENLDAYAGIEIWHQTLNRKLGHQRNFLILRLAQHHRAAGQLAIALDYFIQLGRMDSLDVPTHLSVLDILTKLGRYQEAVDYCDMLEKIYEQEFGAPLPDTILRRCQHSQIQADAIKDQPERHWPAPQYLQFKFINRQSEIKQLRRAFYTGGVVKILGEMGTGKTRLVQEFFQRQKPSPTLVIAPCREMEKSLPFSPIIHGFRHYVDEDIWEKIDTVWANQLCLLLPELTEIRDDCRGPQLTEGFFIGKQHLLDAIHHLLSMLAIPSGRLLFFLDDAQWADKHTLQLLSYLIMQGFFDTYGLLIIATRSEEDNANLDDMVDQLSRSHPFTRIDIQGLNPDDLLTLAQQALNRPLSTTFRDKLYGDTNGNPFITLEIIRNILEMQTDITKQDLPSPLPLPESVHGLIRKRLKRLDKRLQHVLTCAAVVGNTFSMNLLRAVADLNDLPELSAVDRLMELGFFQPSQTDSAAFGFLQFPNEKIREVIIREAAPSELQYLHQRVAQHLSQTPEAKEIASMIADHYLASGEIRNAFTWFLEAAVHAWTLGAKEAVMTSYQQAEKLVENSPAGFFTVEALSQLYQRWSEFAYQSNQMGLLEKIGARLHDLGGRDNIPLLMGLSKMALANASYLKSDMSTSLKLIGQATEYLEVIENPLPLLKALLQKGTYQWWQSDYETVIETANRMIELSNKHASLVDIGYANIHASFMIGHAYHAQGEAKKALQYAQEIYKAHFHHLAPYDRIRSYILLAYASLISGEIEKSQGIALEALKISQTLDNQFVEILLLEQLSKAELIQGFLDEAYKHANQILALAQDLNRNHAIVTGNCVLGDIFFALQNHTRALQYYRTAQKHANIKASTLHTLENNIHLARLLTWSGQLEEAREIIQSTREITDRKSMAHLQVLALLVEGLCDLIEKDLIVSEDKFLRAMTLAREKGLNYEAAWCLAGLARLEMSQHQFDKATNHIKTLIDQSQAHRYVWLSLYGLELHWQLQAATNQDIIPIDYTAMLNNVIDKVADHTQTEPLKQDFENARRRWEKGHHFP